LGWSFLFFGRHRSAIAEHGTEQRKIQDYLLPNIEQLRINLEVHQGIFAPLNIVLGVSINSTNDFINY